MTRQLALFLIVTGSALPQAQLLHVAGIVVDSVTGRPAARIPVNLGAEGARDRPTTIVTGADGQFQFDRLSAGKYQLTADHPLSGRQPFGGGRSCV